MPIRKGGNGNKRNLIKVALALMVMIVLVVAYGYRGSGGNYRDSGPIDQEKACKKQCQQKGLKGQLEPILTIRPANPYAYNGPWKCECEEEQVKP